MNCIKEGYYVWVFYDEYYDPNRPAYQQWHFVHEKFLYGYNLDQNLFYTAGYGKGGSYLFLETKFTDFSHGFYEVQNRFPIKILQLKILQPKSDVSYEFDLENVKNLLMDYLNSENTSKRNRLFNKPLTDFVYGVEIYPHLKSYFETVADGIINPDIRPIHIFWEHKICMTARIKFLMDIKGFHKLEPIYSAFQEIEKNVALLRLILIKYTVSRDKNEIEKILVGLEKNREPEIEALNQLLECIS